MGNLLRRGVRPFVKLGLWVLLAMAVLAGGHTIEGQVVKNSKAAKVQTNNGPPVPKPLDHPGFNGNHEGHCNDGKGADDTQNPFCQALLGY